MNWLLLGLAICAEVVGTQAIKFSNGFTKPIPIAVVIIGFAIAFVSMAQVVKRMDVGLAYAMWAGGGIALVTIVAWIVFDQRPSALSLLGVAVIIGGAALICLGGTSAE
ncbi:MAG: DMT family transporter [Gaiellales bacterium]